ncbi:modification methylase, HemK family protein [Pseudooceanicola batsensis HTCC2597]|uniref:Release factor glutamine methyltransferase n=1 Tax=Pseudooceanicola batsensis (strain ATCC BAA-863 / DSM 15984 / KCTC 12145 / HTCC2597) TaxID=252305 RepID=A3U419_PSEBH|nr:peptide chain release factor N(5)-glutamine methyltransferase [Pseudooceanicola batsensis]EAQ01066.1 modification methylase, HemK family protein [Pseudooceanicola batsensis HTCC2597]
MTRSVRAAMAEGIARLAAAGTGTPERDARRLMAHALEVGADRISLMAQDEIGPGSEEAFDGLIARRLLHEPVSRIVGGRWFYGRWFDVSPATLDPRPETETLVQIALERRFDRVLDLGTGTGCIVISLLAERADARGVGSDLSEGALATAAENAATCGVADRLSLVRSDWMAGVDGTFDLIVSNPPYIAPEEMSGLAPDVTKFDPRQALTDGVDGLGAYRAIAAQAPARLVPGGRLLVEIGPTQAGAVAGLFRDAGLTEIRTFPDLDGRDRVVAALRPQ